MRKQTTVTAKGLRRKHALIIAAYILVSLSLVLWFLIGWRVKTVTVTGCTIFKPETVSEHTKDVIGKHIFGFDKNQLVSAVENSSPYIEKVTLHRRLPNRIEVRISEYVPAGFAEQNGKMTVISTNLSVLFDALSAEEAARIVPCKIILPDTEAFLSYPDEAFFALQTALDAIFHSPFAERLLLLDLSDLFSIRAELSGNVTLFLGSDEGLSAKLAAAARAVAYIGDTAGTVYVTEKGEASFVPAK